jgi:hypothetical protein
VSDAATLNGLPLAPAVGSKFAVVAPGLPQPQGLRGQLSATTSVGATYVLSAEIKLPFAAAGSAYASTITLGLRNSATGAQSAPFVGSYNYATNWTFLSGTVTANANYDEVVLLWEDGLSSFAGVVLAFALVDDVHLCEIAAAKHVTGLWTTWPGIVVAVAVLILGGLSVWWVRRRRLVGRTVVGDITAEGVTD